MGTYLLIAAVVLGGAAGIGGLAWFTMIRPAVVWNPTIARDTFERDALSDVVPTVDLGPYLSSSQLRAYADSGKGLSLTFVIHNDPREAYARSETECGIPQESSYDYARQPRQQLVDSELAPQLRDCVSRFLAPIPRSVPINILVDVTEGVDADLQATLARAMEEQGVVGRLTQATDTLVLMASLIFDHDYSVYRSWEVLPGTDAGNARQVAAEMREWLTRGREPLRESTVSIGLLNGFALRDGDRDRDLRGGLVLVVSDGMQLSRNPRLPDALNFYKAIEDPRYLDRSRWPQFDRRILAEYGEECPDLHGARVVWYSPPRERQPIRAALDYWGHFLTVKCNAGSYLSRF